MQLPRLKFQPHEGRAWPPAELSNIVLPQTVTSMGCHESNLTESECSNDPGSSDSHLMTKFSRWSLGKVNELVRMERGKCRHL